MTISRDWATPLTIGAFILMACTGLLMFFHWDTGLNKEAHEWLGWAMVAGVAAHVVANWVSFKRYLSQPKALAFVGVFVLMLVASFFIQEEDEGGHPAMRVTRSVMNAPLADVASLTHQDSQKLADALRTAGFTVKDTTQTLRDITGPEQGQQFKALSVIFP